MPQLVSKRPRREQLGVADRATGPPHQITTSTRKPARRQLGDSGQPLPRWAGVASTGGLG